MTPKNNIASKMISGLLLALGFLFLFSLPQSVSAQCLTSGLCLGTTPTPFPTHCQGNALSCENRDKTKCTVVCTGGNIFHCNGSTIVPENSSTTNNLLGVAICSTSAAQLVVGQNGTLLASPNGLSFNALKLPFDAPPASASAPYNEDFHFAIYSNGTLLREYVTSSMPDPYSGLPPCGSVGTLASPKLNLQVYSSQSDSQSRRWKFKIINEGTGSIALSNLTIRAWFNQTGTVSTAWSGSNGTIRNSGGGTVATLNPPQSFTACSPFTANCPLDATHLANQQATLSLSWAAGSIPAGGEMDGLEMWATRCGNPCGTWNTPVKDYCQNDSAAKVDYTGVKIVGCSQAYITTSNGNVIFCSNLASAISGDTSSFRLIKGGSVCPSDTTALNTVEVVDNKWLLIGGTNGLFKISNFPQNNTAACASFANCSFSDGTVPVGNINAIKQIDTAQIVAVGSNGQVFYSPNTTSPPVFTNAHAGVPSSETLYAVDGTDLADIAFSGNNGKVYTFNEITHNLTTQTVMDENKGLAITTTVVGGETQCSLIVVAAQFNPCPAPPFTPTPSPTPSKTPTPTPSPTRSPTRTPTPTPTRSPTPTPTDTPTNTPSYTPIVTPTTCVVLFQNSSPVINQTAPEGSSVAALSISTSGCPGNITGINFHEVCTGTICGKILGVHLLWNGTEINGSIDNSGNISFQGIDLPVGISFQLILDLGTGTGTIGVDLGSMTGVTGTNQVQGGTVFVTGGGPGTYGQSVCVGPSQWFVKNGSLVKVTGTETVNVDVNINGTLIPNFSSLYSCTENYLWAVGANGAACWSIDGGENWQKIDWSTTGTPEAATADLKYVTANSGDCTSIQILASNGDVVKLNLAADGTPANNGTYAALPNSLVSQPLQNAKLILATVSGHTERWIVGSDGQGALILHSPTDTSAFARESLTSVPVNGGSSMDFSSCNINNIYVNPANAGDIWAVGTATSGGSDCILHSTDDTTWQAFSPLLSVGSAIVPAVNLGPIDITSIKEGVNNDLIMTGSNGYYIDLNMVTVGNTNMSNNSLILGALQQSTQEYDILQVQPGTILTAVCGCVVCDWQAAVYNINDNFQNCGPGTGVIQVTSGTSAPADSTHVAGTSDVAVIQAVFTNNSSTSVNLTSLTVTDSGTGNPSTGITGITLSENGTDLSTSTFTGSTASFTTSRTIPPGASVTLTFAVDFSTTAVTGTYHFTVTSGTATNGSDVSFTGLPLGGATVTLTNPGFVCSAGSNPGVNWNLETANTGFGARFEQASVVFQNKMWIIGGLVSGALKNDVLSSTDGVNWSQATASAAFPGRTNHRVVVFDAGSGPEMWVVGGNTTSGLVNDVWHSSDGINWIQATASAAFGPRALHTLLVFDAGRGPEMWVIGGGDDVWHSLNGVDWFESTAAAAFGGKSQHTSLVFDAGRGPEMWVIGGVGSGSQSVWHSLNGIDWFASTLSAAFPSLQNHTSVVFDGKMWVISGTGGGVWYSTNGADWTSATTAPAFGGRSFHTSVVFNNRMWVINGLSGPPSTDVWSSGCGSTPPTPTPTCPLGCSLAMNQDANFVIGQPDFFTGSLSPITDRSLFGPAGVFRAGSSLFVSDYGNNRILIYSPVPTGNQPAAVTVIGQADFVSGRTNQNGPVGANTIGAAEGIWSNGTTLIVADAGNNRVLIYLNVHSLPAAGGSADVVIGQPDMLSSQDNQGGPVGANTLLHPRNVFFDGQRLFISDGHNNRVLVYNSLPTTNNAPADEVIGQVDFTSSTPDLGAQGLYNPVGLWASDGNLFVCDGNSRVLVYGNVDNLTTNAPAAHTVIGQNSFNTNISSTSATSVGGPDGVCVDGCKLYIADGSNSRILIYNSIPTGTTNPPADVVLGQPNFTSSIPPNSVQANDFSVAALQAVDGVLYVADTYFNHNRVLVFSCGATPTPTPGPCPGGGCPDGSNWTNVATSSIFAPSAEFASTVFTVGGVPQIWAVGTMSGAWSTSDGSNWTSHPTPFGFRDFPSLTTFDPGDGFGPRMWMIGGRDTGGTSQNDVWSSFDGVTWTLATSNAGFAVRYGHTCLSFGGKLWVIGGFGFLNDVWSSTNGVNWTQETASAAFSPRAFHASAVFAGKMWVIGGATASGTPADVWSSANGTTWTQVTSAAAFPARSQHNCVVACGKMWVLGGLLSLGHDNTYYNDVWTSTDGLTWTASTTNAAFSGREAFGAATFNDIPWVFGGFGNSGSVNDVWKAACPSPLMAMARTSSLSGDHQNTSPTPTPTITATPTVTPTPTIDSSVLLQSVVAAPNVSRGNQPVQIHFFLGRSASVHLSIFTLTGENIFNTTVSGNQGANSLVWSAENQARQSVASGLYIYVLQVDDGQERQTKKGKIALIR